MPGIRLRCQDPTVWGHELRIPRPGTEFYIPLRFDADGYVIVAEPVWDTLQKLGVRDLFVANPVSKPPPLVIGGKAQERRVYQQLHDAVTELAPPGVTARIVRR